MVPSVFTPVLPYCQNRCKNRRYHTARTGVKTEGTILPEQVEKQKVPYCQNWYLLFLHLLWQYGTF
jgi:hypothetical protein